MNFSRFNHALDLKELEEDIKNGKKLIVPYPDANNSEVIKTAVDDNWNKFNIYQISGVCLIEYNPETKSRIAYSITLRSMYSMYNHYIKLRNASYDILSKYLKRFMDENDYVFMKNNYYDDQEQLIRRVINKCINPSWRDKKNRKEYDSMYDCFVEDFKQCIRFNAGNKSIITTEEKRKLDTGDYIKSGIFKECEYTDGILDNILSMRIKHRDFNKRKYTDNASNKKEVFDIIEARFPLLTKVTTDDIKAYKKVLFNLGYIGCERISKIPKEYFKLDHVILTKDHYLSMTFIIKEVEKNG